MKPSLVIKLASPRGFCAGVDRAILIVEEALNIYGAPVYVRHEIVHNHHVVSQLKLKGAVFINEVQEAPIDRPIIFSAHGVPKSVPLEAQKRNMIYIDATCPLVSKVHLDALRHHKNGSHILLIGHKGHPEVIGTMGQLPEGAIDLIEDKEAALTYRAPKDKKTLAFITQTTLSADDTKEIIFILMQRFPYLHSPRHEDICYATTNRQEVVKQMAPQCDALFVIGSQNSSNSVRLVEVAEKSGCQKAFLIEDQTKIVWDILTRTRTLGITAGASAPEILVRGVVEAISQKFLIHLEDISLREENIHFKLPHFPKNPYTPEILSS